MGAAAVAIPLIVASGAIAANAANKRNQSIKRAEGSSIAAEQVQTRQINDAAALQREKIGIQAQQIRGRIRAAASAAGFEDSGTYSQLETLASQDAATNDRIIKQNQFANVNRAYSGLQANLNDISSQYQSTLLAAFSGGMTGANAGLAIHGALPNSPTVQSAGSSEPYPMQ